MLSLNFSVFGQFNFDYDFVNAGRRVCLISANSLENPPRIIINLHDATLNTNENYTIKRRPINGVTLDWVTVAANIAATTPSWTDTNVELGNAFEYQVIRNTDNQLATGYVTAALNYDQTDYKGQMILVIDTSFQGSLASEIMQLKTDLTNEGWFVNELYVPRASTWNTETEIINIKNEITTLYNSAPANDKPTHLFLLGHIPIARSGLGEIAPDQHIENRGARGADCYYADIDGVFTDTQTFNPGGIDANAINLPGDLKWDQDYIPSSLEMAFGRVDFADLSDPNNTELELLQDYLNRLHSYKTVASGWDMGDKTAFNFGFNNSNDASYRSLIPISNIDNVDQYSGDLPFAAWVEQNGPYQVFMQNISTPNSNEWATHGLDATIYSSDQSFWGYWDAPQTTFGYGFIRFLLSRPNKNLGILYTTTGLNIFHQPGMGATVGWSAKRAMDHNNITNLYERPEQPFDTQNYWGRTHLQYNGDPTLRLNQVIPASNLHIITTNSVFLEWSASTDTNILGYHVYRSSEEFGIYNRLTNEPINSLTFTDSSGASLDWYMVRAVKLETTGSGTYLNPSIGINTNAGTLSASYSKPTRFIVYPNPTSDVIWIKTKLQIKEKTLFDARGRIVIQIIDDNKNISISDLADGIYYLKIESTEGHVQFVNIQKM